MKHFKLGKFGALVLMRGTHVMFYMGNAKWTTFKLLYQVRILGSGFDLAIF
jgi:hypothetical protein